MECGCYFIWLGKVALSGWPEVLIGLKPWSMPSSYLSRIFLSRGNNVQDPKGRECLFGLLELLNFV